MPEKTNSAKRHSSIPQTLDRFLERVHDEPEHAPDFEQEIAAEAADFLKRDRRRPNQRFFTRFLFLLSHLQQGSCLSSVKRKAISSRWRSAEAQSTCSRRKKMYVDPIFSDLRTGRDHGIS